MQLAIAQSIKVIHTIFTAAGIKYEYWIVGKCKHCGLIHGESAQRPGIEWTCQCGETMKVEFGS